MLPHLSNQLLAELESLRIRHRLRACPSLGGVSRVYVTVDGAPLVSFSSNDYLGLASHPALFDAAKAAFSRSGFGASASRLVSGTFSEHLALEASLSALVGAEAALLFPTGYQANLGAITALAGPRDLIVADRAVHASLIDACRLSRAKLALYPHGDLARAQHHLRRLGSHARRRLLVTESIFSMDGDVAPLQDLALLAETADAALIVDEAHALGSLGPRGAGLCRHFGIQPDVLIGTLGKALGVSGAFVAGTAVLRSYLINHARSFLFTTAIPPPLAAAVSASLAIATSDQGDLLRRSLTTSVAYLRTALSLPVDPIGSPILPFVFGDDAAALAASAHLRASGFFVQAIRPPTVRDGTARLRITLSAQHTPDQLSGLATALARIQPSPHIASARSATPSPSGLLILGTDTSVGKTTVATALIRLLTLRGHRPVPFKPVETGTPAHLPSDADRLREAANRPDIPLNVISPFRFPHPVAPAAAAHASGLTLSLGQILAAASAASSYGTLLVLETAGGLLTPYGDHLTSADIAAAIGLPVILVARNALGTINHTALSVAEIRRRALSLLGIILVHTEATTTPDQHSNASIIATLTGLPPLGALPYLHSPTASLIASALEDSVNLAPILSQILPPQP